MTPVEFVTMPDHSAAADVLRMMQGLYAEDAALSPVDVARFPLTLVRLLTEPATGRIVLFMSGDTVCGYALLIPYWSNEFGGTLLFVDELFVDEAFRGQGIARSFLTFLAENRPFDAVALALEVSPRNMRARSLYEGVGFTHRHHTVMTRTLNP